MKSAKVGTGGGSISEIAGEAQPGDRLIIEVDGVQRQNFRGEISDVPAATTPVQVSLY